MACVPDELLDVEATISERGPGLGARLGDEPLELGPVVGDAKPPTTAPGGRLDQDGKTYSLERVTRGAFGVDASGASRRDGNPGVRGRLPGGNLVPHPPDGCARGADECQTRSLDRFREVRVLGEESVPWVDRVHPGLPRRDKDCLDVQVGLRRGRRSDLHRAVGETDRERVRIGLAVDHGRAHPELAGRTEDPDRDLSAVGDKQISDTHAGRRPRYSPIATRG